MEKGYSEMIVNDMACLQIAGLRGSFFCSSCYSITRPSCCIIPVSFTAAYDRGAQTSSKGGCQEHLIKSSHADPCRWAGQTEEHFRAAAKLDSLSSSWLPANSSWKKWIPRCIASAGTPCLHTHLSPLLTGH